MSRTCPHCEGKGEVTIGLVVRRARERKKMTQEKLSQAVEMSRPAVANIESDRQVIVPEKIRAFAKVLGVAIDELVP